MNSPYTLVDGIRIPSTSYHAWLRSGDCSFDGFEQLALDCGEVLVNGLAVPVSELRRLDEEQEAQESETCAAMPERAVLA